MPDAGVRTSVQETIERFDTSAAAAKYARSLVGTATHRREERCVARGLTDVPRGGRVLDLPCGTGRLLPLLTKLGFDVVSADASSHMVGLARESARAASLPARDDSFLVAGVPKTPFADDSFDAVVCNRLFHHFREPHVRRDALRELRRICKGPIVVSFFCSLAVDAVVWRVKQALKREKPTDRIPISYAAFARDVRTAGLEIATVMPTRWGISKQWYLVLRRPEISSNRPTQRPA